MTPAVFVCGRGQVEASISASCDISASFELPCVVFVLCACNRHRGMTDTCLHVLSPRLCLPAVHRWVLKFITVHLFQRTSRFFFPPTRPPHSFAITVSSILPPTPGLPPASCTLFATHATCHAGADSCASLEAFFGRAHPQARHMQPPASTRCGARSPRYCRRGA